MAAIIGGVRAVTDAWLVTVHRTDGYLGCHEEIELVSPLPFGTGIHLLRGVSNVPSTC